MLNLDQLLRDVKTLRDPRLEPNKNRSKDVADRLVRMYDRATRMRPSMPDGFPSGGGNPGGGGGSSSSTEAAVLAREVHREDPAEALIRQAADFTAQAASSIRALFNTLDKYDELMNPKGPGQVAPVCCEPHCDALAARAGRCLDCFEWRAAHGGPEAGPVPRAVIEARTPASRVHVSGPLAEGAPS